MSNWLLLVNHRQFNLIQEEFNKQERESGGTLRSDFRPLVSILGEKAVLALTDILRMPHGSVAVIVDKHIGSEAQVVDRSVYE